RRRAGFRSLQEETEGTEKAEGGRKKNGAKNEGRREYGLAGEPAVDDVEADGDAQEYEQRFFPRWAVFVGNVLLAVRAARSGFENFFAAVRAGDQRLALVAVIVDFGIIWNIVIVFVAGITVRHWHEQLATSD